MEFDVEDDDAGEDEDIKVDRFENTSANDDVGNVYDDDTDDDKYIKVENTSAEFVLQARCHLAVKRH